LFTLSLSTLSFTRHPFLARISLSLSLSLSVFAPPRYVSTSIMRVGVLTWCIRACKYVKHVCAGRYAVVLDARCSVDRRMLLWRHQIRRQVDANQEWTRSSHSTRASSLSFSYGLRITFTDSKTHPRFSELLHSAT